MKLTDFYKHVLTSSTYAKDHINKSRKDGISTAEWLFHKFIGNAEQIPLVGALIGLVEGACRGAMNLAGRSSKSFPQKQARDIDTIKSRLLSSDSEDNSTDTKSTSSEVMSSHASRRELIDLHEERKASPEESVNLLNAAMSSGQTKRALALIASKKLDLRAANELAVPPLHLAILMDWTDVALALIDDRTVNLHLKKERGFTYLTVAIKKGNVEIAKALLEHPDRLGDYDMGRELSLASRKGNIAIVELLLNQRKASPEDKALARLEASGPDKDRIIELLRDLHGKLIDLAGRLYPEANEDGICHGFALTQVQRQLA